MSLNFFYALFWCVHTCTCVETVGQTTLDCSSTSSFSVLDKAFLWPGSYHVGQPDYSQGGLEIYLSCFLSAGLTSPYHHAQHSYKTWVLRKHFID